MKVAHYSDTHTRENRELIEEVDLLIHTGDFCKIDFSMRDFEEPNIDITFSQAIKFLEWIDKYPAKYKVITSGNHEMFLSNPEYRERFEKIVKDIGAIFKDDMSGVIEIEGIAIAGAGAYPRIAPYMPLKHAYYFKEGFYNQIPGESVDILLAHACPSIPGNDSEYACQDLSYFLKDREDEGLTIPLLLCGHIHETRGEYEIGSTRVFNSACKGHIFKYDP